MTRQDPHSQMKLVELLCTAETQVSFSQHMDRGELLRVKGICGVTLSQRLEYWLL